MAGAIFVQSPTCVGCLGVETRKASLDVNSIDGMTEVQKGQERIASIRRIVN